VAELVDDLCFIHSMHTDTPEHASAMMMMNVGHLQPTRPSMGSWLTYGLGTENQDLPGFIAMSPRAQPRNKLANWGNAFLPGAYTGTYVNIHEMKPDHIMQDLKNNWLPKVDQRHQADLLTRLNQLDLQRQQHDPQLEASIQTMEMAFRMQFAVPDAFDTSKESKETLEMYGDSEYAKGCLLARRLIERGVRMVTLYNEGWDAHSDVKGNHTRNCRETDQACAALVLDLERRGLLDDTLIVWGGEFGRTPMVESNPTLGRKLGRDHHPQAFTIWMAGGGVRPGMVWGQTDELGFHVVENAVHIHDLQATIMHLMGIDHERLTYFHQGREFRLTDVHGQVVSALIA